MLRSCTYEERKVFDGGRPDWAGDLNMLRAHSALGWPTATALYSPSTTFTGEVAIVVAAGVFSRSCWRQLAAEIRAATSAPQIRCVLLVIVSFAQQLDGYAEALEALKEARRRLRVVAYIEWACGLMLPLAWQAEMVFASPSAPIGFLCAGYPFIAGPGKHWPSVESINELMFDELAEGPLRPPDATRLVDGYANGEQLEGRGVDGVWSSLTTVAEIVNRALGKMPCC